MDDGGEPCTLGGRVPDTREATRDIWGDAGVEATLARVDDEVRSTFAPGAEVGAWVPERIFVAWMLALWDGPCRQDHESLARWADRVTDRGFGTARRLLISLANPSLILRRADWLWRAEHTHGHLVVAPLEPRTARLTLRAHPFLEHEVTRAAVSEAFRYIIVLSRVAWARAGYELTRDGALHVTVTWGDR